MEKSSTSPAIQEFETPDPPRFRWLKRSLLIFAGIIVLCFIVRFTWGWLAQRRLQAEIDAIRARGEPATIDDYHVPDISDDQNAAFFYRQAAAAEQNTAAVDKAGVGWDSDPSESQVQKLRSVLGDDQTSLELVRRARSFSKAAWSIPANINLFNYNYSDANVQRALGDLLNYRAWLLHYDGDDAGAIEILRDMHHHADAYEQHMPILITHLIAVGLDAECSDAAMGVAADLHLATANGGAAIRPATRSQVLALIAALSDESEYERGGADCMYGECWMAQQSLPMINNPQMGPDWLLSPAWKLDVVYIMEMESQIGKAFAQPTWSNAKTTMPNFDEFRGAEFSLQSVTHEMSHILMPSFNRAAETHFRALTDRRVAVLALAMTLYRADHGGSWPASLDELVPADLASLPHDPFSTDDTPLRYKRDAAAGPIIYSVHENGIDDGGSEQPARPGPKGQSHFRWDELDAVYHLLPQLPTTQPAKTQ